MADELALYEGLRLGSGRSFRRLVELHDAPMRRVARLYLGPDTAADDLVRQTWTTALRGLNMFAWHTTFRAWLFGILVAHGRSRHPLPPRVAPPPAPGTQQRGAVDWTTLAWSPRWSEDGWRVLEAALAGLPLDRREVLWLRDVEGWPAREVYDALGLPEAEGRALLDEGRAALAGAVGSHLGADPCDPHRGGTPLEVSAWLDGGLSADGRAAADAHLADCPGCACRLQRARGVMALLAALATPQPVRPPDRELVGAFRAWRTGKGLRPWHRIRLRPTPRSS